MNRLPEKFTVKVWSKEYSVTVNQRSSAVWEAVGDYEGESVRVTDRSGSTALRKWEETAKYRGNVGPAPGEKSS